MIGSGTPNSQSNAPFVKSMSSSSRQHGRVTLEERYGSRAGGRALSVGGQPPDSDQVQRPGAAPSRDERQGREPDPLRSLLVGEEGL